MTSLLNNLTTTESPHSNPVQEHLREVLDTVTTRIAAVWPLQDYVAVNPYEGFTNRDFWNARRFLRLFSEMETLLPLSHYQSALANGTFSLQNIETAISELVADGVTLFQGVTVDQVVEQFRSTQSPVQSSDRRFFTISEQADTLFPTDWTAWVVEEISKHCSAHYDQGQASWKSPWKHLSLYEAWRSAAAIDRSAEFAGLRHFRRFVASLPHSPDAAIAVMLEKLKVPKNLWKTMLLCEAYTVPGWSAWTKYQTVQASRNQQSCDDLAGLLAIRLAYDVAIGERLNLHTDWISHGNEGTQWYSIAIADEHQPETLARWVGLRATEIAIRERLLTDLTLGKVNESNSKPQSQIVFCIDVRSERMRRHLESVSTEISTYGFAGFFALPIAHAQWGETVVQPQVPALISPSLTVRETMSGRDQQSIGKSLLKRYAIRGLRRSLKSFQRSAVGGFGFVESLGVLFGIKLLRSSFGKPSSRSCCSHDRNGCGHPTSLLPTQAGWAEQGFPLQRQIELAEGMLRGIGLTENFAPLVVLCGHASSTENNPLAAGLDCGACGGHSGEFNARVGAMLLNDPQVRAGLADCGIEIPCSTHFLAAVHNTTTDEVSIPDKSYLPATHQKEISELKSQFTAATRLNRAERAAGDGISPDQWCSRAADWSEVRPEWGLAGNTSFIVGPRSMTQSAHLDGRSFLHSYDHLSDPNGAVLEQIMIAPMVVAHWINQQYYASSVDPKTFGSGTKTIHNVVGKFGLLSGGGGDLMTGLPHQSVHDGERLRHEPVRLQAIIAAPRERIETIIRRHDSLDDLLVGSWLHLVAIENGIAYRYGINRQWVALATSTSEGELLSR